MGKPREIIVAWHKVIIDELPPFLDRRPLLRLLYRLVNEAWKVLSSRDQSIEVPAAELNLSTSPPTVIIEPKRHNVHVEAIAEGQPNLQVKHVPAIIPEKWFRLLLVVLLLISIALAFAPLLARVLDMSDDLKQLLEGLPGFGYAGFAVFLAALIGRASTGDNP